MRPAYYGGKRDASERHRRAKCAAVRDGVGIIDVSTLGGLEIRGPDAAAFIDRMYTWAYEKQPVGRARYALMTDQTGVVIDDGVAARLHERHFYVTATTGAVDQVYRQMTWFNVAMEASTSTSPTSPPPMRASTSPGRRRARVIEKLDSDIDFSAAAFPYMAARVGTLAGIPVRVLRVGFVGELGYEIHCPSGIGEALWDRLFASRQAVRHRALRRRGAAHPAAGERPHHRRPGHRWPHQSGRGRTWSGRWPRRSRSTSASAPSRCRWRRASTRKLVGFALVDAGAPAPKECHLVIRDGDIAGRVTSVRARRRSARSSASPTCRRTSPRPAAGSRSASTAGAWSAAETVAAPFYDPENKRQEM